MEEAACAMGAYAVAADALAHVGDERTAAAVQAGQEAAFPRLFEKLQAFQEVPVSRGGPRISALPSREEGYEGMWAFFRSYTAGGNKGWKEGACLPTDRSPRGALCMAPPRTALSSR